MRSLLAYYADAMMAAAARGAGCALGCSGRGDCLNGTCLCEIRYAGDECAGPNMPYHACIGGVFLLVAFVCAVQLTICIVTEYRRLKVPTLLRACKVTTQKMLYLVAFLASLIRGAYFISPSAFQEGWATSLLSAYYPLLMSGSSLIVCFWAEVFHLRDIRWERPRFLSKSFLAFVTFNLINYSLLAAEVLTTSVADTSAEKKNFYLHVFNGCYAVLLFIVVIFFLIYGVEVYFKLRGEFLKETKVCTIIQPGPSSALDDASETLVTKQGIQTDLAGDGGVVDPRSVNQSQLHQSRVGLVSQALMLILIAGFLASETLAEFWKDKVPVVSRNWHDLLFRLVEIGVALWFPCVLWNSMAPERLWLLNPRRLLARQLDDARLADLLTSRDKKYIYQVEFWQLTWIEKAFYIADFVRNWRLIFWKLIWTIIKPEELQIAEKEALKYAIEGLEKGTDESPNSGTITSENGGEKSIQIERKILQNGEKTCLNDAKKVLESDCQKDISVKENVIGVLKTKNVETDSLVGSVGSCGRDCWICYDGARDEPLIRPCRCSGDVAAVHHTCLRRWLIESANTPDGLKCKVCNTPYIVQETNRVEWERGFTCAHWARTGVAVSCMVGAAGGAWLCATLAASPVPRVLAAGAALLVCYICVRFLGMNTVSAYQRAKVSSLRILTEPLESDPEGQLPVSIISKTVTVEMASKAVLENALKGEIK